MPPAPFNVRLLIERVANGWIVEAGCMRFVFENEQVFCGELARWIANPGVVEQEYTAKYMRPVEEEPPQKSAVYTNSPYPSAVGSVGSLRR